ncbi:LysR family transcriptional regulator [Komagataeibacter swingsii]|uniref:HTH lysR-type domain-containing protein n=1 Tax=Komagataeibacter swingsii TaxID=215220 RepID=A0A2V4RGE7_9PROT|nr:LysR family transcriptional regulator [Komagataeibacter swingsii]PYD69026.1 hypothetical protein CFR76_12140 [Komagataeibacter swingsii]GBQ56936.1 transcriptional regulator [Komagataeibacter swingsii DSM 16373]
MNWNDIQYVIAVAKSGSFQTAADLLGANQSTVGRRIQRLESELGFKIFDRHATGMRLTPAGTILVEKSKAMEVAAEDIEKALLGLDHSLSGNVRISVTEGVSYLWLASVLVDFSDNFPSISVDMVVDRQGLNLLYRDVDVSVVIDRPVDPRLVVAKVARLGLSLFISEAYKKRFGLPETVEAFKQHRFIHYTAYEKSKELAWWNQTVIVSNTVLFKTDSASTYLSLVRAGAGIALLPNFYFTAAPDLIPLNIETGCHLILWLVSHEETNQARRTRVLLDFLRQRFIKDRSTWFRL